jgi:hypothetical protein
MSQTWRGYSRHKDANERTAMKGLAESFALMVINMVAMFSVSVMFGWRAAITWAMAVLYLEMSQEFRRSEKTTPDLAEMAKVIAQHLRESGAEEFTVLKAGDWGRKWSSGANQAETKGLQ